MNNAERIKKIEMQLIAALNPSQLSIKDESPQHKGHVGSKTGLGHFAIAITSDRFKHQTLQQRHRMIYEALGDLLKTDIHALKITEAKDE